MRTSFPFLMLLAIAAAPMPSRAQENNASDNPQPPPSATESSATEDSPTASPPDSLTPPQPTYRETAPPPPKIAPRRQETGNQHTPPSASKSDLNENPDSQVPTKKEKKKKKKIKINARIHALWQMTHEDVPDNPQTDENEFENKDPENEFRIRRARFKMSWRPENWLTAVLQVGGFHDNEFGISLLRNAYIHVSPLQYLEIRVGQFKKPFSRLELRSSGKLRVLHRGVGNKLLVEELRYGDRDLGLQFSGRIVPSVKLDYEIGVFNGSGPDVSDRGTSKDFTGRIKAVPFNWLAVGINGSLKIFDKEENENKTAWAAGADAVLKAAGFRTHLEGIVGMDHAFGNRELQLTDSAPPIFNFLAIVSYKHKISGAFTTIALEPAFKFEVLDPNTKIIYDQVLMYAPGFNIYIGKYLRLMVQGEILRSAVNSRVRYPEREELAIQICFDI